MNRQLSINLLSGDAAAATNINLEQAGVTKYSHLSQYDIIQMITLASYGISASTYKLQDCPIEITGNNVHMWLDFYVWPSEIDLTYTLTTNLGDLSESEKVYIDKELDVIFENSTTAKLDWFIGDYQIEWQTPNIDSLGQIIPTQEVRVDGTYLVVDEPIFGVVRLKCQAIGYKYTNDIVVVKEEHIKVTDFNAAISVEWEGGTKQLKLEIPGCAEAYLGRCPDNTGFINQDCDQRPRVDIWYSTCDGSTLHIEQTDPCDD